MIKKIIRFVLGTLLLALGPLAHAQQTGRIARIGFLDNSTASSMAVLLDALRQEFDS